MYIEGRNPVYEAVKSGNPIRRIYIVTGGAKSQKIREIVSEATKSGIRIQKVGKKKIDHMSRTGNHQGIIADVKRHYQKLSDMLEKLREADKDPFFVLVNDVLYQQNLGAIIRTAECAGCTGVIIPNKIKVTERVVRASMGATEHIPIIKASLFNAIKLLKDAGIWVYGLEADGQQTIYEKDLTGPVTIVIGSEDEGLGRSVGKKCNDVIKIPLFGKINSLNMSNATAVTLFEKARQELETN